MRPAFATGKNFYALSVFVLASLWMAETASAQTPTPPQPIEDWSVSVGTAAIYAPVFEGADEYQLQMLPDVRVRYGDDFFVSVPEGVGYNMIARARGQNGWKAGPIAKLVFDRDEDGDSPFAISGGETDALRGLGDVDMAYEIGGFADYQWSVLQSRLEVRQGFGGHEGLVADAEVNYSGAVGPVRYAFGPRMSWASEDYNQTYFGVNAGQSARTGLPSYNADAGIVSYGVGGNAIMPMSQNMSLIAFGGLEKLGDEPRNSSLIIERGSDIQASLGMGVSYRLGWW